MPRRQRRREPIAVATRKRKATRVLPLAANGRRTLAVSIGTVEAGRRPPAGGIAGATGRPRAKAEASRPGGARPQRQRRSGEASSQGRWLVITTRCCC
mmetsp:Transcript_68934/g.224653  ORF Transcript_68934/g.224653 Transcript_68934/m.224653 type:complete len:98 (-) Transcript_68934:1067-1360(-)